MSAAGPSVALALAVLALAGCAEARRCREARREARWTAHTYLESIRPAVAELRASRDARRAAPPEAEGSVVVGGPTAAEELARLEAAVPAWEARLAAVRDAHALLKGAGPVAGDPLAAFAARDDEANPAGAEAARRAIAAALDVCGRAP